MHMVGRCVYHAGAVSSGHANVVLEALVDRAHKHPPSQQRKQQRPASWAGLMPSEERHVLLDNETSHMSN